MVTEINRDFQVQYLTRRLVGALEMKIMESQFQSLVLLEHDVYINCVCDEKWDSSWWVMDLGGSRVNKLNSGNLFTQGEKVQNDLSPRLWKRGKMTTFFYYYYLTIINLILEN